MILCNAWTVAKTSWTGCDRVHITLIDLTITQFPQPPPPVCLLVVYFFINTIAGLGTTFATGDWLHMVSEIFIIRRNKMKHFLSKLNHWFATFFSMKSVRPASSSGALIAFSCVKCCCVYDAGCRARPDARVVHATVFRARKSNQSSWGRGCCQTLFTAIFLDHLCGDIYLREKTSDTIPPCLRRFVPPTSRFFFSFALRE